MPRAARLRSIDLLRGVAVLLMVAAHVSDAFLADAWKDNPAYSALNITFGFVAPGFLLLSGITLGLSLQMSRRPPTRRLLWILALAYWLQIPLLSLRQLVWNRRPDDLARLLDTNILHVVAVGGLLLVGLAALAGRERARWIALALAIVVIAATPVLWSSVSQWSLPLPVRSYLAPQPLATFSLFPYLAYSLIGFAVARDLAALPRRSTWIVLVLAVTVSIVSIATAEPGFWHGSIAHTLFRLAGIVGALAVALLAGRRLPARTTLLERIGAHSLAIYVLHLVLVYGSPVTMGARYWLDGRFARSLDPLETLVAYVAVAVVTCAAALGWSRLRLRAPRAATWLWWGFWSVFAALFLLTP